jgi:BirA family biotin operon repressor/biotin-[acetyl-CoA-carboxylase] ligase
MSRHFSRDEFRKLADEQGLRYGQPLTVSDETVSTNDDALTALKAGAAAGAVFVAERQSGGRGRHGRQWHSVAGESLTFSLILRPKLHADRLSVITLVVGLAVRDALIEHGAAELGLKWPNDIVHQGKKLVGILVEKPGTIDKQDTSLVVGVGVNVGVGAIPPDLITQATAFGHLVSALPSRERLLVTLLRHLERRVTQLEHAGFAALLPDIRACDALLDRQVTIEGRQGKACGIGDGGELLVEKSGRVEAVTAGLVLYAP